jgi:hypothetical protein
MHFYILKLWSETFNAGTFHSEGWLLSWHDSSLIPSELSAPPPSQSVASFWSVNLCFAYCAVNFWKLLFLCTVKWIELRDSCYLRAFWINFPSVPLNWSLESPIVRFNSNLIKPSRVWVILNSFKIRLVFTVGDKIHPFSYKIPVGIF